MRRITLSSGVRAARMSRPHSIRPCLEILEDRLVPAIDPTSGIADVAVPQAELVSTSTLTPNGGPGQPAGFSPGQISQAYGFNQIYFNNGTIKGDGSGQTIAIVDAYNQPNIASDLHTFRLHLWTVRAAQFHGGQPERRQQLADRQSELGAGNKSRRGMGARHGAGGEHPARRGQQRQLLGPDDRRELRPQSTGRLGGVDELGQRRMVGRVVLRQLLHDAGRPSGRYLRRLQRRQRLSGSAGISVGFSERPWPSAARN